MAALVDAEPERLHMCYEGRETFEVAIDPPKSWRYGPVVGRALEAFCGAFNARFKGVAHVYAADLELRRGGAALPLDARLRDVGGGGVAARPRRDGAAFYAPSRGRPEREWPRGRAVDAGGGAPTREAPPPEAGAKAAKARAKREEKRDALLRRANDAEERAEDRYHYAAAALGWDPACPACAAAYVAALGATGRWARAADFLEALPLGELAHWPAAARRAACCGLRFASRYAAAASLGVAEDAALIDAQRAAKLRGDALLDDGDFAAAAAAYGSGVRDAAHPSLFLDRALAHARDGDYARAAADYGRSLEAHPRCWRSRLGRARCDGVVAARFLTAPRSATTALAARGHAGPDRERLNGLAKAHAAAARAADDAAAAVRAHRRAPLVGGDTFGDALAAALAASRALAAGLGLRRDREWDAAKMRARRDAHGDDADDGGAYRARVGPDKLDGDRAAREARRARVADHYEVLGVPRDADLAAITKAYKKKALETHPDKNLDDPDAEAKFLKVQEARVILSNKDARALYDLELGDDVDPGG